MQACSISVFLPARKLLNAVCRKFAATVCVVLVCLYVYMKAVGSASTVAHGAEVGRPCLIWTYP
jgi:hypothetical protein